MSKRSFPFYTRVDAKTYMKAILFLRKVLAKMVIVLILLFGRLRVVLHGEMLDTCVAYLYQPLE